MLSCFQESIKLLKFYQEKTNIMVTVHCCYLFLPVRTYLLLFAACNLVNYCPRTRVSCYRAMLLVLVVEESCLVISQRPGESGDHCINHSGTA